MSGPKVQGLAIAWLQQEDWPRWLAMDPGFQPHYQHWLKRMTAAYEYHVARGIAVVKVVIDPDELEAWAKQRGIKPDTHARAAFAGMKAMQADSVRTG